MLLAVGVPLVAPLVGLTFSAPLFPLVGAVLAGSAAALVALVSEGFISALVVVAIIVISSSRAIFSTPSSSAGRSTCIRWWCSFRSRRGLCSAA